MPAPSGLALVPELTHSGFGLMVWRGASAAAVGAGAGQARAELVDAGQDPADRPEAAAPSPVTPNRPPAGQ